MKWMRAHNRLAPVIGMPIIINRPCPFVDFKRSRSASALCGAIRKELPYTTSAALCRNSRLIDELSPPLKTANKHTAHYATSNKVGLGGKQVFASNALSDVSAHGSK